MVEPKKIRVLVVEDSDDDAVLITEELHRGGYAPDFDRVETAEALRTAIAARNYDVIISDFSLPQFTAMEALKIVQGSGKDIPVIVVSGSVRETTIVDTMRAGARDYVMKENLVRLPLAVGRELEEAAQRGRRRQFEEQLRHTQRLESLGVLAGGVAHDFNNLLTGILGNVSLAVEDLPPTHQVRGMLEQALQATEHAANLTRQMLAYAGKGKFVIEQVDVSAAIREIKALLDASVFKNVKLLFELKEGLPAVEADRGQIHQVVLNLAVNAAESIGPEKSGTVLVTTGTSSLTESDLRKMVTRDSLQPGRYVCMEVRDTGSGMDGETQSRIFDPFFTTKFTGRGLGLSAVMGIIRSHHGALRVQSEPGKGSTFTVFLPVAGAAKASGEKPAAAAAEPSAGVVLVIDDEETIRQTARTILEKHGVHTVLAENGLAGVEAFRELSDQISLVLLDLTMPGMSGRDVLREVRALSPDVPVILSSGYEEAEARRRVQDGEVTAFIQKPYTARQLLAKVSAAMTTEKRERPGRLV